MTSVPITPCVCVRACEVLVKISMIGLGLSICCLVEQSLTVHTSWLIYKFWDNCFCFRFGCQLFKNWVHLYIHFLPIMTLVYILVKMVCYMCLKMLPRGKLIFTLFAFLSIVLLLCSNIFHDTKCLELTFLLYKYSVTCDVWNIICLNTKFQLG